MTRRQADNVHRPAARFQFFIGFSGPLYLLTFHSHQRSSVPDLPSSLIVFLPGHFLTSLRSAVASSISAIVIIATG